MITLKQSTDNITSQRFNGRYNTMM